jgi:ribosomal protein S18 acetylase RimI-like enzyme
MVQRDTPSAHNRSIISAEESDFERLAFFLNQNHQIHRHLDWFTALDYLGKEPYLLEVADSQIFAVLCAAPENEKVAWVRVYGVMKNLPEDDPWNRLLPHALSHLKKIGIKRLAALSLHSWFESLLNASEFRNRQNIVVLEWEGALPQKNRLNNQILIRPMQSADIPIVAHIDHLAFPPLWQNCRAGLEKAFSQTGISTVALNDGEIVGYQISTTMTIYGHLARLAVHPDFQRRGIAFSLVYNLLSQFKTRGFWRVTVNTQSDNKPSLKLYDRFGFTRTSEQIPVYDLLI